MHLRDISPRELGRNEVLPALHQLEGVDRETQGKGRRDGGTEGTWGYEALATGQRSAEASRCGEQVERSLSNVWVPVEIAAVRDQTSC